MTHKKSLEEVNQDILQETQQSCCNNQSTGEFKKVPTSSNPSCCDSISSSCCDTKLEPKVARGSIRIDGKKIELQSSDKNIVDVTKREKIPLPAPCYLSGRKSGCCKSCVIKINGNMKYGCTLFPEDGMNIEVNTEELNKIRKLRLKEYAKSVKSGIKPDCSLNK